MEEDWHQWISFFIRFISMADARRLELLINLLTHLGEGIATGAQGFMNAWICATPAQRLVRVKSWPILRPKVLLRGSHHTLNIHDGGDFLQ